MPTLARLILICSAAMIVLGGLVDLSIPRLPSNLLALCGDDLFARRLVRELLRALGGSLVAIGVTVAILVMAPQFAGSKEALVLILVLVLPAEGVNAVCMYRVGSPFYIPLSFAILTLIGVLLAWPGLAN